MQVSMYADLRAPMKNPIFESFEGELDECLEWAYQKTHEMIEYFPKRNHVIRTAPSLFPTNSLDFVVYSEKTKHYMSFRFDERKELP